MGRLDGKVAIITGAASGIGEAEALYFAKEGAKVTIITRRRKDDLERVAREIEAMGSSALPLLLDVSKQESWDEIIEKTMEKFGKINILVNNAAVRPFGTVENVDIEETTRALEINVLGMLMGMKAVVPKMKENGEHCAILNTSSVSGPGKGQPDALAYSATKSAIVGMSRSAARDLEGTNIRLNIIYPGLVRTNLNKDTVLADPEFVKRVANAIPVGRVGEPMDIAPAAAFLCSDEALYIHGAGLFVDGGQTIK